MEIFLPILGLALTAAILAVFLKQSKMPVLAVLVSVTAGAVILMQLLPRLAQALEIFTLLAEKASLNQVYLGIILKIIAITYIGEFTAQVCRDAGQAAMATKIDLTAKVMIIILAVPVIAAILDGVTQILP
ncbi:MAG: stage III sporulation protein AD [Clostridia bacterium]|jgi:stage III sporulation protein AD|nr:stage III sporulation protein AD [Clostridia bacterium]